MCLCRLCSPLGLIPVVGRLERLARKETQGKGGKYDILRVLMKPCKTLYTSFGRRIIWLLREERDCGENGRQSANLDDGIWPRSMRTVDSGYLGMVRRYQATAGPTTLYCHCCLINISRRHPPSSFGDLVQAQVYRPAPSTSTRAYLRRAA